MQKKLVSVADAQLQVSVWGRGEPVVFIQTALTADELQPIAAASVAAAYRKILNYRPGYRRSSATEGARSIGRDARECVALLQELDITRAHVVGLSYSGAVALQLAVDAPEVAHTLTLIEPPPLNTLSEPEFRAAIDRLIHLRWQEGSAAALDEFLTMLIGPDWQRVTDSRLPGSSAQMQRDSVAFFDADLPALLDWKFDRKTAFRINCPVLYIGGTNSGTWFADVRELMLSWFAHADDVVIEGADHSLALTHAAQIANTLIAFLRRHPMRC